MVKRLMGRGATSGRADDNAETIRRRLATFEKESLPVIRWYERVGKLQRIDATYNADEVYANVKALLGKP